jgi:CPA1 family monovalent cation:H+ antiporter
VHQIETVFALLVVVAALVTLARRFAYPYPIVLVLGGLLLGFVPGLPEVRLDPEIVFLLFLPPILYSAAVFTSFRQFRANLRPISLLAVGLVLTTTVAIATVAHAVIRGLTWPAALALGAIVSPPDAVAATAITRKLGVPQRIVTILEGESLVNDASALIAYRMAVAAAMTGLFSFSDAALRFALVGLGGVGVGLAVGWLAAHARRRVNDPPVQITLSLLTPFAAYLPAEALGVSGVLAVVTTGLYIGATPLQISPGTRLQALAVWEMVVFLLNGFIFILIGLQLPGIMAGLSDYSLLRLVGYAVLISLTAIVVRFVWVFPASYLPRLLSRSLRERDPYPGWRNVTVVAWTAMRGVVSLAAAFALPFTLPSGAPFPQRELILFLTFGVILATLVLQGLSLPWLLRRLGVADARALAREERTARLEAARAAIARLEQLAAENGDHAEHLDRLRWRYERRNRRLGMDVHAPENELCEMISGAYERLRRDVLNAEREVIRRLRDEGAISDEVMLRIDRELDLEDTRVET